MREKILGGALAAGVFLGACGGNGGDGPEKKTATDKAADEDFLDKGGYVHVPTSDHLSVSKVEYLGQTEFFDGDDHEQNQFLVEYADEDGNTLECIMTIPAYERKESPSPSQTCNWEEYNAEVGPQ